MSIHDQYTPIDRNLTNFKYARIIITGDYRKFYPDEENR